MDSASSLAASLLYPLLNDVVRGRRKINDRFYCCGAFISGDHVCRSLFTFIPDHRYHPVRDILCTALLHAYAPAWFAFNRLISCDDQSTFHLFFNDPFFLSARRLPLACDVLFRLMFDKNWLSNVYIMK